MASPNLPSWKRAVQRLKKYLASGTRATASRNFRLAASYCPEYISFLPSSLSRAAISACDPVSGGGGGGGGVVTGGFFFTGGGFAEPVFGGGTGSGGGSV